ncbi:MAG: 50S ribosomal protein L30 [Bacteroidota bacterium]|nr:50S ribosomal protein L30 [Bacteroidota bacterium]
MAKVKVTLTRSKIGMPLRQKRTLTALGLNKTNSSAVHDENSVILGMIRKVHNYVKVEKTK